VPEQAVERHVDAGSDGWRDVPVAEVATVCLDYHDAAVLGDVGRRAERDLSRNDRVHRRAPGCGNVDAEVEGSAAVGDSRVAQESPDGVLLVERLHRTGIRRKRPGWGHGREPSGNGLGRPTVNGFSFFG
jgi:hypothetical protein